MCTAIPNILASKIKWGSGLLITAAAYISHTPWNPCMASLQEALTTSISRPAAEAFFSATINHVGRVSQRQTVYIAKQTIQISYDTDILYVLH
jgi:hypothetical protein